MKITLAVATLSVGMAFGMAQAQSTTPTSPAKQSAVPVAPVTSTVANNPAVAEAPSADKPNTQRNRMTACNHEAGAKELKGDERKGFMKQCLSKKSTTQQEKMKTCNASAKAMKGDERKRYMSECLKNK